jgi:hypothetical protein
MRRRRTQKARKWIVIDRDYYESLSKQLMERVNLFDPEVLDSSVAETVLSPRLHIFLSPLLPFLNQL